MSGDIMQMLNRPSAAGLLFLIIVFNLSAFTVTALRSEVFDVTAIVMGVLISLLLLFQYFLLTRFFRYVDRYVLIIANILADVGFIIQYRLNPDTALRQIQWFGVGMVVMVIALVLVKNFSIWDRYVYYYMSAGIALLILSLIFGKEIYGAKNWIRIGGMQFQPSEFVKILLIFILAGSMKKKKRVRQLWPLGAFVATAMILLVLQRDLGAALLYFLTFIITFYIGTSNILVTAAGLMAAGAGAVISYHLFNHVRVRVNIWQDPWSDISGTGYQIAQSLMAIASGGLFGLGLHQGTPKVIPAYHTDFIFAVICEEFGILIGIAIIAFYVLLVIRGGIIALNAKNRFHAILAFGCTSIITLQSFIIIGGVIKMIPLTGITLPFISYGGSSMVVNMALIGILEAVAINNGLSEEKEREKLLEEVIE